MIMVKCSKQNGAITATSGSAARAHEVKNGGLSLSKKPKNALVGVQVGALPGAPRVPRPIAPLGSPPSFVHSAKFCPPLPRGKV